MTELISRQDVIDMLVSEKPEPRYPLWWLMKLQTIPAKSEPDRGNWIYKSAWMYKIYDEDDDWQIMLTLECSECEMYTFVDKGITYDYCPHCGAKMRGEIDAVQND